MRMPRVRFTVLWMMLAVAILAALFKAEDLRRRRALFLLWAGENAENERIAAAWVSDGVESVAECRAGLAAERSRPGTTGMTEREWERDLAIREEMLDDDRESLESSRDLKAKCLRAASRPWESPWPMRLRFWPTPVYVQPFGVPSLR